MARKTPVSPAEIAIGKRLAEAREDAMVNQTALAIRLGIARERLVKYEAGIVPLPLWPGLAACEALNINQCWLATGEGPFDPFIALDWKTRFKDMPKRALFSEVFEAQMKPLIEHRSLIEAAKNDMRSWEPGLGAIYRSVTASWLTHIRASHAGEFVLRLAKAAERILNDLEERDRQAGIPPPLEVARVHDSDPAKNHPPTQNTPKEKLRLKRIEKDLTRQMAKVKEAQDRVKEAEEKLDALRNSDPAKGAGNEKARGHEG